MKKRSPGPSTYNLSLSKKIVNKTQSKVRKMGYMGELEYKANQSPGIGKYDVDKSVRLS